MSRNDGDELRIDRRVLKADAAVLDAGPQVTDAVSG